MPGIYVTSMINVWTKYHEPRLETNQDMTLKIIIIRSRSGDMCLADPYLP